MQILQHVCEHFTFILQCFFRSHRAADKYREQGHANGGAFGKDRRREERTQCISVFNLRDQHAEAIERMQELIFVEAQRQAGDRRIIDFRKGAKIEWNVKLGHRMRWNGQDHIGVFFPVNLQISMLQSMATLNRGVEL